MDNFNPIVHTIRPGDTLYNLATRYCTTVDNILNANMSLDPYNLRVGEQIYIYSNCNQNNGYLVNMNEVRLLEKMNLAWEQHIMWTRMLLISIAENLKDLDATQNRLLRNPKDIANIFRPYYGANVATQIERLLTEHLEIGKNLIVALKDKNETEAEELSKKWYQNADAMADLFNRINPFYPRERVRNMFYDHLRLITDEVKARLRGDYKADIEAYDLVQKEALEMSRFFVNGIAMQFPNLF